jgi:hypothetical protein
MSAQARTVQITLGVVEISDGRSIVQVSVTTMARGAHE